MSEDDFDLRWITRKVAVKVRERICINCGKRFLPKIVMGGSQERGTAWCFKVSGAKTCTTACANQRRGEKISEHHEKVKAGDPEAYQKWMGRDYSEMGKRRHEKVEAGK